MITKFKIKHYSELNVEPIEFQGLQDAQATLKISPKGTAIVVVEKTQKARAVFIAYHSELVHHIIGRRLNSEHINTLAYKSTYEYLKYINLPTDTSQLQGTWQILDGWWSEYFGDYARANRFVYFQVTIRDNIDGKKYKKEENLIISTTTRGAN